MYLYNYQNLQDTDILLEFTEPPQCFGDYYDACAVENDSITAYRNYYNKAKQFDKAGKPMHVWSKRDIPEWFLVRILVYRTRKVGSALKSGAEGSESIPGGGRYEMPWPATGTEDVGRC